MMIVSREKADAIVARHVPTGWTVSQTRRRTRSMSAEANPTEMQLNVPVIEDARTAALFFHEVAHVNLGHFRLPFKAAHVEEYEAERMAGHLMGLEGIPLPAAVLQEGKDYVRTHIAADERAGVPISPVVRKWCGEKKPRAPAPAPPE
jgi:hypothetical protein